jgi:hypothetical protein
MCIGRVLDRAPWVASEEIMARSSGTAVAAALWKGSCHILFTLQSLSL